MFTYDFPGLQISDGTTWYPMPSKHCPAYSTLTIYSLASVCLCSEILERDTGASSEFVAWRKLCQKIICVVSFPIMYRYLLNMLLIKLDHIFMESHSLKRIQSHCMQTCGADNMMIVRNVIIKQKTTCLFTLSNVYKELGVVGSVDRVPLEGEDDTHYKDSCHVADWSNENNH